MFISTHTSYDKAALENTNQFTPKIARVTQIGLEQHNLDTSYMEL